MVSYTVDLEPDDGTVLVSSAEFPELTTYGEDKDEAMLRAKDALEEAIAARIDTGADMPAPSSGRHRIALSPLMATKVVLYQKMRRQQVGMSEHCGLGANERGKAMNWKRMYWLLLLPLMLWAGAGHARVAIANVDASPIPDGLTMAQIERAIVTGTQRGWIMTPIEPGHIEAEIVVRSHVAVVDIRYDESVFSIQYKRSSNLDYKDGRIHRNYNRWILNLERDLKQSLHRRAYRDPGDAP